ncbi:sulfite exporter TauE/SafE family protein [uncultured Desulfosarcina sp.]|uniref:sulfite exporter TauE/SafE family protein n=1 Tax=uncultured Desulfosarcina sp. TaxID=218289 RepID=UPI0029C86D35|nr:sulfite exporter TauE/SafE family protein [uncultured Desulfosarcina sp.]
MDAPLALFTAFTILVAGCVRGYGGFGFSMITVAALSLVLPPERIVPMILMLEVGASLLLLPGAWSSVNWPALAWMLLGVGIGTPLGVWLLGNVSPACMKTAVAAIIFALAFILRKGVVVKRQPGRAQTVVTGTASGILNGAAAIGGPPAVLFFFSSPAGAAVSRASLIAYFLLTDILAAGTCLAAGLMTVNHARQALLMLVPMAIGLLAGQRMFHRTSETVFRKRVLLCLMGLSVLTLIKALWEMIS